MKYIKYTLILTCMMLSSCVAYVPYSAVYEIEPPPRYVYRYEPDCRNVVIYTYYGRANARKCTNVVVKRRVVGDRW